MRANYHKKTTKYDTNIISWADSFLAQKLANVTECVLLSIATVTVSWRQRAGLKRHKHSLTFILHTRLRLSKYEDDYGLD